LREKYGPESFVVKSNIPTPNWFFDEQGKVVTDTGGLSFSSCAMGGIPHINAGILNGGVAPLQINLIQPLRQTGTSMDLCRALVTVRAAIQPGTDPKLAIVMSVSITDGPLETRAREATVDFLAQAAAARTQALESAAPPLKPKL